jgi:hypothetical protein
MLIEPLHEAGILRGSIPAASTFPGSDTTARSPAEWPGFVVSALFLYRKRATRSR